MHTQKNREQTRMYIESYGNSHLAAYVLMYTIRIIMYRIYYILIVFTLVKLRVRPIFSTLQTHTHTQSFSLGDPMYICQY